MHPFAIVYLTISIILSLKSSKFIPYILLTTITLFHHSCGTVVATINLPIHRLLSIISLLIVLIKGEAKDIKIISIDRVVILWSVTYITAHTILRGIDGFIYIIGTQFQATGVYFIMRATLKSPAHYKKLIYFQALLIIILASSMLYENIKHFNLFSIYSGAPPTSYFRDGRYRCHGSFAHAILAGTYGAIALSLISPLLCIEKKWKLLLVILSACSIIILTSASSGAVLAALFCLLGYLLWPLRYNMVWVRRGVLVLLIVLSMFMKAPVWYIIAKIGYMIGGTGWHRSYLIDQAIKYFNDWWFVGTIKTGHWFPYQLASGKADITNQFIAHGINGGFFTMFLFVLIIVYSFRLIGLNMRSNRRENIESRILIWSIGVALVGHIAAFFSVSYYDQSVLFFFITVSFITVFQPSDEPSDKPIQIES